MMPSFQSQEITPSSFRDEDIEAFQLHLQQTVELLQAFVKVQETHA